MKRISAVFLALVLAMGMLCVPAGAADAASGTWGALSWSLSTDGILTVSGSGAMDDIDILADDAWSDNSNDIKSVVIKNGVTSIGEDAFFYCEALKTVSFPGSLTSIGDSAFFGCSALESVSFPESVVSIGDGAFDGCTSLKNVTLPEGVTSVGYGVFLGCTAIKSAVLPKSLTEIESSMFEGCTALESVTIPEGVEEIGYDAFSGCTALQSIDLPESLMTISGEAFSGCALLKGAVIPKNVTYIGTGVFENCSSLETLTVDAENTEYHSADNCIIDTSTNRLVSGCKNSVIPDYVTGINTSAFTGCTGLKSVHIPDSVTWISTAFDGCSSLETITVGEGNTVYSGEGNCIFVKETNTLIVGCKASVIPDSVITVDDMAFYNCDTLVSIEIPVSVTAIEEYAFCGCTALESITIPDSVVSIGANAFCGCTSLKSLTVPGAVTEISGGAFSDCAALESLNLGTGVKSIGDFAFSGCEALKDLIIPDSVTEIGSFAFSGCSALESVTVGTGVSSIDSSAFSLYGNLKLVYVKSADVAKELSFSGAEGYLIYNAETVILANTLSATDFITVNYPVTGTATVGGEKVNWYKKANRCAVHLYEDDVCAICGQVRGEEEPSDDPSGEGHVHKFGAEWKTDAERHWHECSVCGERNQNFYHVYDDEHDTVCNVCGYVRKVEDPSKEHVHSYTGWESDEAEHWHVCTVCGEKLNAADHVFDGDVCSVCGYTKGTVALLGDANGDGAVNNIDASLVLQYDAGVTSLEDAALAAADVNSDASVNNIDASRILQLDAGVIPGL